MMKSKIIVSFRSEAVADRYKERLKRTRPLGYTSAARCQYNSHPAVFVFGQFDEAQERYIKSLKYERER